MAEVIGPCSTLPGALHKFPFGTVCDKHPERLAVARVQGETDSFGAELIDMCAGCLDEHRTYRADNPYESGTCDWCKSHSNELKSMRDYEEGSCGRVYQVCTPCRTSYSKAVAEELADEDGEIELVDDSDDGMDSDPWLEQREIEFFNQMAEG